MLKEDIKKWLQDRAFFADTITKTEMVMQNIYFDGVIYNGKESDQQEIEENCHSVEEAYYYVKFHKMNAPRPHYHQ